MNIMKKVLYITTLFLMSYNVFAQTGTITNVEVKTRGDGSGMYDILYDLTGTAAAYNISVEILFNGETAYIPINKTYLQGDIATVTPGTSKRIEWNGLGSFPNQYSEKTKIKIVATGFGGDGISGTFTDPRDGKTYKTVKIGNQEWFAENLAYLPAVSPASAGSTTSPHYYVYNYNGTDVATAKATTNFTTYGVLYNFEASKAACPPGWHLPTDAEWTALENYLIANGYNYDGTTTGNKIAKSLATTTNWNASSGTGSIGNNLLLNNKSGFSALPGGYRDYIGNFSNVGNNVNWWNSVESSANNAWSRSLGYNYNYLFRNDSRKDYGFSIRCIKDNETSSFTDPRDNKTYKTVKIGNQEWFAENLAYLPAISPPSVGSNTAPNYYVNGYTGTDVTEAKKNPNYSIYGVLYNWEAAKAACPPGWHLPTDAEWKQLEIELGMTQAQANAIGIRGTDQGSQMKSTTGWPNNTNGTNTTGYSALPGGGRETNGTFWATDNAHWWSSTKYSSSEALTRDMGDYSQLHRGFSSFGRAFSVRCIKNYETSTFTDSRDGKTYKTVKIGNQEWFAENLAYLPAVSPATTGSTTSPNYYVYNYNGTDVNAAKATTNYSTYGVLYNWEAAKVACPPGWHLPTDAEWKQLEMTLGMSQSQADATGLRGTDQGTQMKSTSGWNNNGNGTNTSGFSGLPSGYRKHDGSGFSLNGQCETWWTSTNSATDSKWCRYVRYNYSNVERNPAYFSTGLSVRCIKDTESSGSIPTKGLVAYYPFNGNADDESMNGNNGTPKNNFSYVSGYKGQSIRIVGSGHTGDQGGHVLLPVSILKSAASFTISMWVNEEGMSSSDGESYISFGTSTGYVSIAHYSNELQFCVGNETGALKVPFDSSFKNKWTHYVLAYDNNKFDAYINGILIGSKTQTKLISFDGAAIGRHWFYNGTATCSRLIGSIDQARIYNRALTVQEIQSLFKE
jgi:uncharacterized protein (TIGR02145 family)